MYQKQNLNKKAIRYGTNKNTKLVIIVFKGYTKIHHIFNIFQ